MTTNSTNTDKNHKTITRLRKIGNLHRLRRLCNGHYYLTQDNLHVTFTQRPTEQTMEAIKKMVQVATDHLNKMNRTTMAASKHAHDFAAGLQEIQQKAKDQPKYPIIGTGTMLPITSVATPQPLNFQINSDQYEKLRKVNETGQYSFVISLTDQEK